MDWGWLYGTLIRNTGWTFQQCGEQSAADCFDLLEHLSDYPPDYVILAGYYGAPKPRKRKPTAIDEVSRKELTALLGPAQPIPEDIRRLIDWAESYGPQKPN